MNEAMAVGLTPVATTEVTQEVSGNQRGATDPVGDPVIDPTTPLRTPQAEQIEGGRGATTDPVTPK